MGHAADDPKTKASVYTQSDSAWVVAGSHPCRKERGKDGGPLEWFFPSSLCTEAHAVR